MKIPIFTDEVAQNGGWHGQVLQQAFSQRGVEAIFVNLSDCVIDLSKPTPTINIPGFERLPTIAFVRGIAAGSLQQVITRLNVLHILRMLGCKIYNDAKLIEKTVDKGMTSFLLKQQEINTPATWVCESRTHGHTIIDETIDQHQTLVVKPLFGSQGKGVRLLTKDDKKPLPRDQFVDGVYYLQQYIEANDGDYRVFVVNNQAIATIKRKGHHWLHNVAQGAHCELISHAEIETLAMQAAQALEADYCGVDIIQDMLGQLWVLEVNSIPAWRGLQSVCDTNIAQCLADDLLSKAT